jgi:hypothetical protein
MYANKEVGVQISKRNRTPGSMSKMGKDLPMIDTRDEPTGVYPITTVFILSF